MDHRMLFVVGSAWFAFSTLACSSARDVEVSGKVTAPSTLGVQGDVLVEFLDVTGEGAAIEKEVAHSVKLESLGDFEETVSLAGDKLIVRAINDRDGDGKCSAGEAWGEVEAAISAEDEVEPVTLSLAGAVCPAE